MTQRRHEVHGARRRFGPARRGQQRAGLAPLVLLLGACGESAAMPTHTVRDSAGIEIVESTAPGWAMPWRLADAPEVSIGVTEGEEAYQFSDLVSGFVLDDGRIVAVNRRRPAEIRVFDASGRHLRTLGGEGEGPGEFGLIFFADHRGDTIRAYDPSTARITRFTAEGALVDIVTIANVGPDPATRFILFPGLRDGGFLARSNAPRPGVLEPGRGAGMSELVLTDAAGAPRTEVIEIVDGEYIVDADGGALLLFTPRAATVARDSLVYAGSGADFSIDVYDTDLRLRRRIRRTFEARPVDDALVAAHVAERIEAVADPSRRMQLARSLEGRPARSHIPAHDATMLIDASGNLWVRGYPVPGEARQVWSIFDARGAFVGELEVPSHLGFLSIAEDRIIAVATDSLDVQRLEIWRLLRQ